MLTTWKPPAPPAPLPYCASPPTNFDLICNKTLSRLDCPSFEGSSKSSENLVSSLSHIWVSYSAVRWPRRKQGRKWGQGQSRGGGESLSGVTGQVGVGWLAQIRRWSSADPFVSLLHLAALQSLLPTLTLPFLTSFSFLWEILNNVCWHRWIWHQIIL